MQNTEKDKNGTIGVKKIDMLGEGENYHFQKGGRINIVFGPKHRPLILVRWKNKSKLLFSYPRE
jgi:hypothetical protein